MTSRVMDEHHKTWANVLVKSTDNRPKLKINRNSLWCLKFLLFLGPTFFFAQLGEAERGQIPSGSLKGWVSGVCGPTSCFA